MALVSDRVLRTLAALREKLGDTDAKDRLSPAFGGSSLRIRPARTVDAASIQRTWSALEAGGVSLGDGDRAALACADPSAYCANVENMVGTVKVPVGVVAPLRINGVHAKGDFAVPMATTEAALVASYARGADLVSRAGGASAAVMMDGVVRAPGFRFADLSEAGAFVEWVARAADDLKTAADATSRHGRLAGIEPYLDNDLVFLVLRFTTGEASGQNMVTIATEALCRRIEETCPVRAKHWFLEVNFSGDKKATYLGLLTGRGRKVTASVVLPGELVERRLHATVERMLDYATMANLGALLSGQLGAQGHYANGIAALYLATGQDVACVSESSVGFTRMERRGNDLFVSVTLPNVLVGTVGGGTGLPSQAANLRMIGLAGAGSANGLAEVAASLCLAGEISIMGALAAGQFARAHHSLARKRV